MLKRKSDFFKAISMSRLFFVSLPIIIIGLLADRAVKQLAVMLFKNGDTYELIPGILRLTYAENKGAAFSMLSGQLEFFIILSVIVLIFAFYVLIRGHIHGIFGVIALSVCISGAIGNFIDRLAYGYVVDMFEPIFINFAIFNVADILLNVGGAAFAIYFLFVHDRAKEKDESPIDIKSSDYMYISVTDSELTELSLKDEKIEFRIKRYKSGSDGEMEL
jgi:signal peptidase II